MKAMLIVNNSKKYHLLEKFLISEKIEPKFFECEISAIDVLQNENDDLNIDVVLIETEFNKVDSFQLCELINKITAIPVIMLSESEEGALESKAFDIGCSDYIKTPYTFDVLIRRLKNCVRKISHHHHSEKLVIADDFVVDSNNRIVIIDGNEIRLSNKEFAILSLLTKNPEKTFSRIEIIEHVWNSEDQSKMRIVDSHVKNIRKKTNTKYIETVSNIGYRLKRNTISFD